MNSIFLILIKKQAGGQDFRDPALGVIRKFAQNREQTNREQTEISKTEATLILCGSSGERAN